MKAFIFDFDGVIVDSERHWRDVGDKVFYPSLVPGWTLDDGARMMGLGFRAGYDLLVREYGLKISYEEYVAGVEALIDDMHIKRLQLLPGLHDLIARVERMKVKIGIASSGGRDWIQAVLKEKDLLKHFPVISCSNDVQDRTKPHPDVYLLAAKRLEVATALCTALEDSTNGIAAAKAAGMKCIALKTDMSERQDLSAADMIIRHYDELTEDVLHNL